MRINERAALAIIDAVSVFIFCAGIYLLGAHYG